jgi:UDP-N-acetyl-alpha-D-muramoyl-L-alanyl-L-glutamate epimerase
MQQDQFAYTQFRVGDDRRTVYFDYLLLRGGREHKLTETIEFPVPLLDSPEQRRSLRALHLALGVSYYKMFLPPTIVQPYAMDQAEAGFWNDIWRHGLGEFLYVNKLSADRLATFTAQDGQSFAGETAGEAHGALLGIGGGKDSIVAGELLKDLSVPVTGFVMATGEQLGQTASVARAMGVELHAIKRQIDRQLLELQEQPGGYKGHVPISLIFGLVGTALAIATGSAHVVVANEASASIPRVMNGEQAVNHQWSKSFGFEKELQRFVRESIATNVTYFSAIRQLTSIGVAKLFARLPQYFEVFTSDNFVFRMDPARRPSGRWSLESPKSLSSYLLLAPWLADDEMQRIFTIDFLNEASLENLFLSLVGAGGEPPLDCVGTVEELTLSVNLLAQADRYTDTVLMKLARERGVIREADWQQTLRSLLQLQSDEALPANLRERITTYFKEHLDEI